MLRVAHIVWMDQQIDRLHPSCIAPTDQQIDRLHPATVYAVFMDEKKCSEWISPTLHCNALLRHTDRQTDYTQQLFIFTDVKVDLIC